MKKVHFIVGPTASGKTFLSQLISEQLKIEIVSADSRQIYRYLDIGTAKPDAAFRAQVPHHFIDICDPDEYYSAGIFGRQARQAIENIFARNAIPLVVGGSGFYIKALVDGIFELDAKSESVRERLERQLTEKGLPDLFQWLREVDPRYANKISSNDRQRILRALEVFLVTGKPFSYFHQKKPQSADFVPVFWGLELERNLLYQRIDRRAEQMLDEGLLEEVRQVLAKGYHPDLNALNTVGYRETIEFIQEKISYQTMLERIQRNTRRYAKRQLTWFRADPRVHWVEVTSKEDYQLLSRKIITAILKNDK